MENDKLYFTEISQTNYKFYEELLPTVYRTAFRKTPEMIGLGANLGDRAVGIILFTEDLQLHLCRVLYITVDPAYRRQGIAERMLLSLARAEYDEFLYTTAAFLAESTDDPVYRLFDTCGEFTVTEEEGAVYSSGKAELNEALGRLRAAHNDIKDPVGIQLGACSNAIRNEAIEELEREGYDIVYMLHRADPELSRLLQDKDGKMKAMILAEDLDDKKGFLLSFGWTRQDPVAIMMLLIQVLTDIYNIMDDDGFIRITAVDKRVIEMVNKLFENKTIDSRLYEAAYNGDDPM